MFDKPDQVKTSFLASCPATVYKYRSWSDQNHRRSLTDLSIWYSNPKTLNDLWDIRLPYEFAYNEVYHPAFYEKLCKHHAKKNYDELQQLYDEIKSNPKLWVDKNYNDLREGAIYEEIGVFSTSEDPVNDLMWAHYGKDHTGFCIGYDSFKILSAKKCSAGRALFIDTPPKYSFIKQIDEGGFSEYFLKNKRWEYEKEFRFLTFVDCEKDRLGKVDRSAIKEVILGRYISNDHKDQILNCLRNEFASEVDLFQITENPSGYGLSKQKMPLLP